MTQQEKNKAIIKVRKEPRWGNDHECEGHIHRATYAGDGCRVCDEIMLREFSKPTKKKL